LDARRSGDHAPSAAAADGGGGGAAPPASAARRGARGGAGRPRGRGRAADLAGSAPTASESFRRSQSLLFECVAAP
jgi:hypothetical protein